MTSFTAFKLEKKKIVQMGSSKGISFPSNKLKEQNLDIGDRVNVLVSPIDQSAIAPDLLTKLAKELELLGSKIVLCTEQKLLVKSLYLFSLG